jgi:rhomboid protease GluP
LILLNLGMGFVLSGIDNFAHIGGLIGGIMMTHALGVKDKGSSFERTNGWIIVFLFTAFLMYFAFVYSA